MQADLVIVGAGMVGSALALALGNSPLKLVVVDAGAVQPQPFQATAPFEPRVSALSLSSQTLLEQLGAWSGVQQRRLSPYTEMSVWDGTGTGAIHFSAASIHVPVLGHIVENRLVQDALLEALIAQGRVTLLGGHRLETLQRQGQRWSLQLSDGTQLETPLLVAADGAQSAVRRLAGCATREWDYLHHAIVTSVRCEQPHQQTAWQRFTEDGPLAFLPLWRSDDPHHWCSIVWSCPPERAQALMALDDEMFAKTLGEAFEYRLGAIQHADTRLCVPLRQRHAKRYVQPGLALLGDAAHTIHPLAGQGVNLGFLDVAELAGILLKAQQRGESLASEAVLSRFERRRMPQNLVMMAAMEGLERLFQARSPLVQLARNLGLRQVEALPELKSLFVRQALGVQGALPDWLQH